jgi:hypothetical protein
MGAAELLERLVDFGGGLIRAASRFAELALGCGAALPCCAGDAASASAFSFAVARIADGMEELASGDGVNAGGDARAAGETGAAAAGAAGGTGGGAVATGVEVAAGAAGAADLAIATGEAKD